MSRDADMPDIRTRRSGRQAPRNIDAEESVLGAMLLSKDAIDTAMERLNADHFYVPAHGFVFEAIEALYAASEPVDCLTVADQLERSGHLNNVGGADRLLSLEAATPTLTHIERYARIVEDTALLRRLISVSAEISELAYSRPDNTAAALDQAEALVYSVAERRIIDSTRSLHELIEQGLDRLDELYQQGGAFPGMATGFASLDRIISGIQPSSLVVVGARPAMGKTAFGLTVALNVALRLEQPVLLFSLEMSHSELAGRLLASDARVDATRVRTGQLNNDDWGRVNRSVTRLGGAPMWIDDNPNVTVTEIRAKARRLRSRLGGLGLVVVDYLQLMSGRSNAENRQVEIAEISRGLKILARELETPIMALSQLSRGLETRGDKRPMLSDLRESGSIEQDADVVMFIYRDEVYNEDTAERGMAEIIVAKHRNGPTGVARLAFMPHFTLFADMAGEPGISADE